MIRKDAKLFDDDEARLWMDIDSMAHLKADKKSQQPIVRYVPSMHADANTCEAGIRRSSYNIMYTPIGFMVATLVACIAISFGINFFDVAYSRFTMVQRFRHVAEAELRQECCLVYYSEDEMMWPKQKTTDCMRILEKDAQAEGKNRCDRSKDVVGNVLMYQWILEMWAYYVPMARYSFIDTIWTTLCGGGSGVMIFNMATKVAKFIRKLYFV